MRAHKIRLFPNKEQEILLKKSCGVARFAYNWALAQWNLAYENKQKVNEGLLRKQLNSVKRDQFPWMLEVTKCAPEQAIRNLGTAFSKFFKKKANYPKFKKKGFDDRFYISNDQCLINNKTVKLPKTGTIRICSNCDYIKSDLTLKDRIYKCEKCGFLINRDLNAAINLKKLGACCSEVKPVEILQSVIEAGNLNDF